MTQRDSLPSLAARPHVLRRLYRAVDAVDVAGDRAEIRMQRRLQLVMGLVSVPMIGSLGAVYAAGGHWNAALWPAAYVVATAALIALLLATGEYRVFAVPHLLVVLALPMAMHFWLGGYVRSGGVMLWTLLVPVTATMVRGARRSVFWFLAVMIAVAVGYLLERPDAPAVLSSSEISFHFAFNTIGFTGFLFVSTRHFVARIDAEKARADQLLLRVLPAPIVRRLKREQGPIADHLDGVTVVFADIVGFTPLAAKLSASEVVGLLDEIFSRFDQLAAKHGVEKIKTIGDAYMAVAGAPERCTDHASRAARLALDIRAVLIGLAAERRIDLSMRIGLHTGEAVAGVIGIERFAYDLWGDTVNTASRMESHGTPGEIQITAATRDALGSGFVVRERGPIEVKGRGTIVTYWLDGLAPT